MIRICIADDHAVVLAGLRALIDDEPDMEVVAEADRADDLAALCRGARADVLILDISMPGPGLLEVLDHLQRRYSIPVLVLTVHPEHSFALRAFRHGAAGFLNKDRSPEELVLAIRRVYQGGRYVPPALVDRLVFGPGVGAVGRPAHEGLSDREFQVFLRLARGVSQKSIAAELGLSPKTVTTYRSRVLEKLGVETNADLVRYALQNGLSP